VRAGSSIVINGDVKVRCILCEGFSECMLEDPISRRCLRAILCIGARPSAKLGNEASKRFAVEKPAAVKAFLDKLRLCSIALIAYRGHMTQKPQRDPVFPLEQPVTALLGRWKLGDRAVEAELIAAVYPYMRALANSNLKRLGQGLMQSTELAHEAFIRLQSQHSLDWQSRAHFLAVIAAVTRNVVIDLVREQHALKRGGGEPLHEVSANDVGQTSEIFDWLALDEALRTLSAQDAMCGRVTEIKLFSSMEAEEISEALGISIATIGRHWRFAKTWLAKRLELHASKLELDVSKPKPEP
jgi:RNA polymerase sigma factor (TIGR02999 family)